MPSSVFFGMQHLNNNLICAVSAEATGPDPFIHEIIELCVLPLDQFIEPHKELLLFNIVIKPEEPSLIDYKYCRFSRERVADAVIRGLDKYKVADLLRDWFDRMLMPEGKRIIPIGYEWPVDRELLLKWLEPENYFAIFSDNYRDVKVSANYINDRFNCKGEAVPYSKQDLRWLAKTHDIEKVGRGCCMEDCRTIAMIYQRQLKMLL